MEKKQTNQNQLSLFPEDERESSVISDRNCPFCSIVKRTSDSFVVFRDHEAVAFLDVKPVFLGHTLVVPANHYETLFDMPPDSLGPFFQRVQLIAQGVQLAMSSDGTFVAINNKVSQSVMHLHVHIIPRRFKDGLKGFFWPRQKYDTQDQALEVQQRIKSKIDELVKSRITI